MVLCKHFQQGNCRFGSKCNFEHIDIKQLVKSDVELAINGKQYLFSCYGPFKDKPCIPNFIQDQSFEEIRLMCYEARQKNYFEQFHQQLQNASMDAINKMKSLANPSYEIFNMLTTIYDTPVGSQGNNQTTTATNSNNPFGLASNTANNTTASSIFGKSNLSQTNNNANAFGGISGIFGGGGAATNSMQSAGSIFGGQQPPQNSIFGQVSQPQQTVGSIFGGGGVAKPTLFGQQPAPAATQSNPASGFGLFAQAAQTTPAFGQPPSFGQAQQMQAQQTQQQQPLQQQQQQQSGTIFGQSAFGSQQPNMNPFGQPQQQQLTQNMFAQPNAMMATQQSQQQQANTNLFSQVPQQQPPTQAPGFFQQTGASTMATGNVQQPQQAFAPVQQAAQPAQPQMSQNATSVYSRMEDLTTEQIAAFKAEIFEPGKLPLVPPPLELINI